MLEFYFHPVLGLQYSFTDPLEIIMDIDFIPKTTAKDWLSLYKTMGIQFIDSTKHPELQSGLILSNF